MLAKTSKTSAVLGDKLERMIEQIQDLSDPPALSTTAAVEKAAASWRSSKRLLGETIAEVQNLARTEPAVVRFGESRPGPLAAEARSRVHLLELVVEKNRAAYLLAKEAEGAQFLSFALAKLEQAAPAINASISLINRVMNPLIDLHLAALRRGWPLTRLLAATGAAAEPLRLLTQAMNLATEPRDTSADEDD